VLDLRRQRNVRTVKDKFTRTSKMPDKIHAEQDLPHVKTLSHSESKKEATRWAEGTQNLYSNVY